MADGTGIERPIIFSAPMIRALLEGRKTQTRRVLKPKKGTTLADVIPADRGSLPRGGWVPIPREKIAEPIIKPGDRLWVRENCRGEELDSGLDGVRYKADDAFGPIESTERAALEWVALYTYRGHSGSPVGPWVHSIHMPRWASRMTLAVTEVRVQRLQEISEADARAEGIDDRDVICGFSELWDNINGPGAWEANPWVAAISFTVEGCP